MDRWRGLRSLVHDAVELITDLVEETQDAQAARPVRILNQVSPPLGEAAARIEDARKSVAGTVFESIRTINRGVEGATGLASAVIEKALGEDLTRDLAMQVGGGGVGRYVDGAQSALNAVVGDFLAARGNPLAIAMQFVRDGAPLALNKAAVSRALPEATPKLAIFVHGLGCNEDSFRSGARQLYGDGDAHYGPFLARDLGYTPLYVRYNTGLHVSQNGRALAQAIAALIVAYPCQVQEIALIGYSMGGLVARSAAHYARLADAAWLKLLAHIMCIGSPHLGAPLEKASHQLASLLGMVDLAGTQVPAKLLRARSAGIKDLRFGYVVDEDWTDKDPDGSLTDDAHDVPLVDGVSYGFIAASWLGPEDRMGGMLGDLIVRLPSSTGKGAGEGARHVPFHLGHVVHGVSHLGLINHPDVYTQLKAFLSDAALPPKPPGL